VKIQPILMHILSWCPFFFILDFVEDHFKYIHVILHLFNAGSWSYGSCIDIYICNQCLSPLKLWVQSSLMLRCTRYDIDKVCQCRYRSVVFFRYS